MTGSLSMRALGAVVAFGLAASPASAQTPDYAAEIERIASHPAVQRAMDMIESTDDRTMADLRELTQIPAPPFMETERGLRFREMLDEAGADSTWIDDEGNVTTEDDILFIGTVGEEGLGDLRGMKHLFREGGPQIDAFISIDGTSH